MFACISTPRTPKVYNSREVIPVNRLNALASGDKKSIRTTVLLGWRPRLISLTFVWGARAMNRAITLPIMNSVRKRTTTKETIEALGRRSRSGATNSDMVDEGQEVGSGSV